MLSKEAQQWTAFYHCKAESECFVSKGIAEGLTGEKILYTHVPFLFRTKGNGKCKAQFYSAWPKRQDANRDDMQDDRTLGMWTNPSYNRIKRPQHLYA